MAEGKTNNVIVEEPREVKLDVVYIGMELKVLDVFQYIV